MKLKFKVDMARFFIGRHQAFVY